mmetsp:Transcript_15579/g.22584  ORF Transcript_15579/g.22584 Transcript_15579/m.22584 type:complete len:389 (+) Transcript_15579:4244-5410(+)
MQPMKNRILVPIPSSHMKPKTCPGDAIGSCFFFFFFSSTIIAAKETCREDPFEIEIVLHPKRTSDTDFHCTANENIFIAEQIARDINYVIVRTGERLGVTRSKTRICKEGRFLSSAQHGFSTRRGLFTGPVSRQLRQHTASRRHDIQKFVFKGTGSCRICDSDNTDNRQLLLSPLSVNSTASGHSQAEAPQGTVKDHRTTLGRPPDAATQTRLLKHEDPIESRPLQSRHGRRKKQIETWRVDATHSQKTTNIVNKRKRAYFKYLRQKQVLIIKLGRANTPAERQRVKEKLERLNKRRSSNEFGFFDYMMREDPDFRVGFYIDGAGRHKYYYHYKKATYNFQVLSEILSKILKLKFHLAPINSELCTYGKIQHVSVTLTRRETFDEPEC